MEDPLDTLNDYRKQVQTIAEKCEALSYPGLAAVSAQCIDLIDRLNQHLVTMAEKQIAEMEPAAARTM